MHACIVIHYATLKYIAKYVSTVSHVWVVECNDIDMHTWIPRRNEKKRFRYERISIT